MAISAAMVKELREKTGAGMMDCQRALSEADGNLEEAIKILRKKGLAAAAKKAGRTAKDGLVVIVGDSREAAMAEINCETDFVARTEEFQTFARAIAEQARSEKLSDVATAMLRPAGFDPGQTIAQALASKIAKIGENILFSRVAYLAAGADTQLGTYLHMGGKIGVIVELSASADEETVKDVAMHIAAAEPRWVRRDEVAAEVINEEREIARAQAAAAGKPAQVLDKIADGKVGKFFEQFCLVDQAFVKDPAQTVGAMLAAKGGVTVTRFVRFRLGEGAAAAQ
ncbi:MAG: elongation factor Ts [Thermoanaerobaculaceae bacterium]|nr:elongation factor Ts [Thermoanaerobaculaceae bacterium]MDI9622527.1 translation elongation factor Ts [Acidobacteriota bacterium]NLH12043.1 elongation factor Ts [Holophagae bacterium]HPW56148.1 translation elongation factor Ts [Thermoanaerobaculaceae bacterium]